MNLAKKADEAQLTFFHFSSFSFWKNEKNIPEDVLEILKIYKKRECRSGHSLNSFHYDNSMDIFKKKDTQ